MLSGISLSADRPAAGSLAHRGPAAYLSRSWRRLLLFGAGNGIVLRHADDGRARRCGPAGCRSRLRAGQRQSAARRRPGRRGAGDRVRLGQQVRHRPSGCGCQPVDAAEHAFVYGADHAFVASIFFLVAALVLVAAVVRAPKPAPASRNSEDRYLRRHLRRHATAPLVNHTPQLRKSAAVEWQPVEILEPSVSAIGDIGESAANGTVGTPSRLPRLTKSSALKSPPLRPQ